MGIPLITFCEYFSIYVTYFLVLVAQDKDVSSSAHAILSEEDRRVSSSVNADEAFNTCSPL